MPPKKKVASLKKPVASKPVASKPVASKPVAKKPVAKKPVASKPVAKKPVAKKPVAKKTVTKKSRGGSNETFEFEGHGSYHKCVDINNKWVKDISIHETCGDKLYKISDGEKVNQDSNWGNRNMKIFDRDKLDEIKKSAKLEGDKAYKKVMAMPLLKPDESFFARLNLFQQTPVEKQKQEAENARIKAENQAVADYWTNKYNKSISQNN